MRTVNVSHRVAYGRALPAPRVGDRGVGLVGVHVAVTVEWSGGPRLQSARIKAGAVPPSNPLFYLAELGLGGVTREHLQDAGLWGITAQVIAAAHKCDLCAEVETLLRDHLDPDRVACETVDIIEQHGLDVASVVPILLTYFVDRGFLVIAGPVWGIAIPTLSVLLAIWFRRAGQSKRRAGHASATLLMPSAGVS